MIIQTVICVMLKKVLSNNKEKEFKENHWVYSHWQGDMELMENMRHFS